MKAVAFDLFTLFDPRGIAHRAADHVHDDPAGFADAWMARIFEYSWLRAAAGSYAPFDQIVMDALGYTARARRVTLAAPDALAAVFTQLAPWPDARASLAALRERRLRLAPLANFAPAMIRTLLASAQLAELFDLQISTDAARTYKPDPRAYALAEHRFDLPRERIAFAAFGRWDAWGASRFGLRTFWVDRLGQPDELGGRVATGPDLGHLIAWLDAGARTP